MKSEEIHLNVSYKMIMKIPFIIGLFFVMLLSVIAVTTGTTITTQILQPAYSQAQHCEIKIGCVTPGQTPTIDGVPIIGDNPHHDAGRLIGNCHSTAARIGITECTVTHP